MAKKRCQCLGNTLEYGHNSGCPLNPMSNAGCLALTTAIPVGVLIGLVLTWVIR